MKRNVLTSLIFSAFLTAGASGQTETGTIRGHVSVSGENRGETSGRRSISHRYFSPSERPPAAAPDHTPHRYGLSEKTVLYLEADGELRHLVEGTTTDRVILDQRKLMFYPHVLAVQKGTTVIFPNNDEVYHNVFSYSRARQFDLGRYPRGQFRTVQFNTPGVVRIYCDIHAHMNAVILVLDNQYFAKPDDDGNFIIHGIPPGSYTINFWYGRDLIERRGIEISPASVTTESFRY